MKKLLYFFMAMVLSLMLVPGIASAGTPVQIGTNYAFICNSNEASVSKVDLGLVTPMEVARYSTIPVRPDPSYTYHEIRVSRLAMDSGGNAWALNTMTGIGAVGTQGSVARINFSPVPGEVPGSNTSNTGGLAGIVLPDVRVSYFNLGGLNDQPRTINIVESGGEVYMWIGFYHGGYFQKYWYNKHGSADLADDTLDIVLDTYVSTGDLTPYVAAIDSTGILWFTSRASITSPGVAGVGYFDINNPAAGVTQLEYDLDNPYHILVKGDGTVWVSDGSSWGTTKVRYFAVYNTDTLNKFGSPVYIGTDISIDAMRGFMEDTNGDIWATGINGVVMKLDWDGAGFDDADWVGTSQITGLGELTGLGADADGDFWVIRHGANSMSEFAPGDVAVGDTVALGAGPYLYGNFVQAPQQGRWTGGGTINATGATIPAGVRVTHGFEFHNDLDKPNNLQVNWGKGERFHLTELLSANCFMNPGLPLPDPPTAPVNEVIATGVGKYKGADGYTINFHFTDVGEPGANDYAKIVITAPDGTVVLSVEGTLHHGNQQAHIDNK